MFFVALPKGEVLSIIKPFRKMHVFDNLCILDNMLENELRIYKKMNKENSYSFSKENLSRWKYMIERKPILLISLA